MTLNRIQDSMFDNSTSLTTNSKSVKGAINEVNASIAQSSQQLTNRSYDVKFPPVPLVAAVCDGTTDDSVAINALINYVSTNGGGVVQLPKGTIKANILINKSNVTLRGAYGGTKPSDTGGMGGTILVPNDVTKPIISVGDGVNYTSHIRLVDLFLNGTSTTDGLYITGAQYIFADGVNIFQCRDNIHITSTSSQACSAIYLNQFTSQYAYQNCLYADWGGQWTTAIYATNYRIITDQTKGVAVKLVGTTTLNTFNGYIDTVQNQGFVLSQGANVQGNNTIVDLAGKTKGPGINIDQASTTQIGNFISGNITLNNANIGFTDKQLNGMYQGILPSYMYSLYPNTIGANVFYRNGDIDGAVNGYGQVYKDSSTNNMMVSNSMGGVTALPQDTDAAMFLVRKYTSTKPQMQFQTNGGQGKIGLDLSNANNKVFAFMSDWGINFQFPNDYGGNHLMIGTNHLWVDSNGLLRSNANKPTSATDGLAAGGQVGSGTTRPNFPKVGYHYFDTTLNKPIWVKTAGTQEVETLTVSTGATTSGNISITLNGSSYNVAVSAGDSTGNVGDKIRAANILGWTIGGTAGTATVTFTKNTSGTNSAPAFSDSGTTGTTASISTTTAGTANTWVDATGTTV